MIDGVGISVGVIIGIGGNCQALSGRLWGLDGDRDIQLRIRVRMRYESCSRFYSKCATLSYVVCTTQAMHWPRP